MKKALLMILITLSTLQLSFAKRIKLPPRKENPDLTLSKDDLIMIPENEGGFVKDGLGFHLYIKKRGDIQSVLLCQIKTSEQADMNLFVMRDTEKNSVNGNEKRHWKTLSIPANNESLPYMIMATNTEQHNKLGEVFHLYIPKNGYVGYLIENQDTFTFEDKQTVTIKAFEQKNCDILTGAYVDNIFELNATHIENEAEKYFGELSAETNGTFKKEKEAALLTKDLNDCIAELKVEEKVQIVFVIDATESMKKEFEELTKNWLPALKKQIEEFKNIKIGLLLYKDYKDSFNYKNLPVKNYGFAKNIEIFSSWLLSTEPAGGHDKPEAVYEALFSALKYFSWNDKAKKKIILIGDAEPHITSKKYKKDVIKLSKDKNIVIDCILIQEDSYDETISETSKIHSVNLNETVEEIEKSINAAK